jgi:hypothetical protein
MSPEARDPYSTRLRWKVLLGIVVVLGGAIAFYTSSNHLAPTMSYRLADQRTLVITAGVGVATWTRVAGVAETDNDVRVAIESLDWPVTRTMQLELVEFTIVLSHDLGDRVVRDGSGAIVPRQGATECETCPATATSAAPR